jgi:hypothetical protein
MRFSAHFWIKIFRAGKSESQPGGRNLAESGEHVERFDLGGVFCDTFDGGIDHFESGALEEGGHGFLVEEVQVLVALDEAEVWDVVQPDTGAAE